MAQNFSGALKIMDLDDFIAPAQVSEQHDPSLSFSLCLCVCGHVAVVVCSSACLSVCVAGWLADRLAGKHARSREPR